MASSTTIGEAPHAPGIDSVEPSQPVQPAIVSYRTCRRGGVTPRDMVDCMDAAVALRHRASLLAADSDLDLVAQVMGITMESN